MKEKDKRLGLGKRIVSFLLMIVICASCGITSFAANYESEPNNSIGKANNISVNTTYYASGEYVGGTYDDYYKFSTSSDGYIQIQASKEYGKTYLEIEIYKYDGTDTTKLLYESVSTYSETGTTSKLGLPKGTYYLNISYSGDYNFKVNFTASKYWEKETNNNIKQANNISINTNYYASGEYVGGTYDDYYKFSTSSDGYIKIQASKEYGKTYLEIEIYKYDGTDTTKLLYESVSTDSETGTTKKLGLPKGTYYLNISYSCGDYNFKVLFGTSGGSEKTTKTTTTKTKTTTTTTTKPAAPESPAAITEKTPDRIDNNDNGGGVINENKQVFEPSTYATVPDIPEDDIENDTIEDDDYTYVIIDYTVIITDYHGDSDVAVVPTEADTPEGRYDVTGIGDNAFSNSKARTIQVPSSITSFGTNAFGEDDGTERVIVCEEGSPAAAYCEEYGIPCEFTNSTVSDAEPSDNSPTKNDKIILAVLGGLLILAVAAVLIVFIVKKDKNNRIDGENQ